MKTNKYEIWAAFFRAMQKRVKALVYVSGGACIIGAAVAAGAIGTAVTMKLLGTEEWVFYDLLKYGAYGVIAGFAGLVSMSVSMHLYDVLDDKYWTARNMANQEMIKNS